MIELMALMGVALVAGIAIELSDDDDDTPATETQTPDRPVQTGNLLEGTDGADTLTGTLSDNSIVGRNGSDEIRGQAGDDRLFGDAGQDSILGDTGDDLVAGGSGNDLLSGGEDNDTVFGNSGDDVILEGRGADVLNGDQGNDLITSGRFNPGPDGSILSDSDALADTVNGGSGNDTLLFGRGDIVTGGEGQDDFLGGSWIEGHEAATITDFEPDEDQLIYAYRPDSPAPELTMTSEVAENGSNDAIIYADGQPVFRVVGHGDTFDPALDIVLVQDGSLPDGLLRFI